MLRTITAILLLLVSLRGFSQTGQLPLNTDNSELFAGINMAMLKSLDSLYVVESGCSDDFISGREYRGYYYRSDHKPILFYGRERTASLIYKGRTYTGIILQYDTFLDQLIYMAYNNWNAIQIALNSDNISRFDLYFGYDTLIFRYLSDEQFPSFNLDDGFYEVVYEGKCKYIVKHKSLHYMRNGVDEYDYKPAGYVRVNDGFVKITSRKQFVKLFGNKSKEIKQFIADRKISIGRADKRQIEDILIYYETLVTEGNESGQHQSATL